MKRKITKSLAVVMSACMLFSSTNVTVNAEDIIDSERIVTAEEYDESQEVVIEDFYEDIIEIPDSNQLLEGYLYYGSDAGVSLYSYDYNGNKLTGLTRDMYDAIKAQAGRIVGGVETNTKVTISLVGTGYENKRWTAEELGVSALVEGEGNNLRMTQEAREAISEKIGYDYRAAWQAALRDCPYEMYWAGLSISTSGYTVATRNGEVYSAGTGETLTIGFIPSDEFRGDDTFKVDVTKTQSVENARLNAIQIVENNAGLSDVEKMKAYVLEICDLVTYNNAAAGGGMEYGNPWQLVYVFDGDPNTNVVCEGYSKAFQYLMENSTLESDEIYTYIVSGLTGGNHMWNVAHMDDGKNYLLDVTNCDAAYDFGLEPYRFFLIPATLGDVNQGYTFDVDNFDPITFSYDSDTRLIYSDEELEISTTPYVGVDKTEKKINELVTEAKGMNEGVYDANANCAHSYYNYITCYCELDETGDFNTIENVLLDGKGTEQAILDTYAALLTASDIDYEVKEVAGHKWFVVANHPGDWFHVDIMQGMYNKKGHVYLYFGLDDAAMSILYPQYNEDSEEWCGIGTYALYYNSYTMEVVANEILQDYTEQIQNAVNNRETEITIDVDTSEPSSNLLYHVMAFYLSNAGRSYDSDCVFSDVKFEDDKIVISAWYDENETVKNNPDIEYVEILDESVTKGESFKVKVKFGDFDDEISSFCISFAPTDPESLADINNVINAVYFTDNRSKEYVVDVPTSIKSGDYKIYSVFTCGPNADGTTLGDSYMDYYEDENGQGLMTDTGDKQCAIKGSNIIHVIAPTDADETNPIINNIKVPYGTTGEGGEFSVEFDVVEDDSYINNITINFSAYTRYGFADNFAIVKTFNESDNIKTGHYVLTGVVPTGVSCVDYQIASVSVWDSAGNSNWYNADIGNTYGVDENGNKYIPLYGWPDERCYISGNTYLRVTKKVDGGLANGSMVSIIRTLEEGENAEVKLNNTDKLCSASFFDTIKDKDIDVSFKKDNTSWVFNGKDIVNDTKDIELDVKTEVTKGTSDKREVNLYKVEFPSNGELPGKCSMEISSDYFEDLYGQEINVFYFDEEKEEYVLEASANAHIVKADDRYYCSFDVNHNSTFMLGTTRSLDYEKEKNVAVSYRTHVQNVGWQDWKKNGAMSGTSGQSAFVESIEIKSENVQSGGGIQYRTYSSNGDKEIIWKKDGETSGTDDKSLKLEAIEVKLYGEMEQEYDIYYRVHVQYYGWLAWAKNGETSGTSGYGYGIEGIQIILVQKGASAPTLNYGGVSSSSAIEFVKKPVQEIQDSGNMNIKYRTHVQNIGWQNYSKNGELSGTNGKSLRVEGIEIQLENNQYDGGVKYRTDIQNIGWQEWKKDGELSGTNGQGLRIEAIEIELYGIVEKKYDVYYRVHVENVGWLAWAKNGETSGTTGYGYRIEGVQIVLVEKEKEGPSPNYEGVSANSTEMYLSKYAPLENIEYLYITNFYSQQPEQKVYVKKDLENKYVLFLPVAAELNSIKLHYENEFPVSVNGKRYMGEAMDLSTYVTKGIQVQLSNGESYNIRLDITKNVASMFIDTDSGSMRFINSSKDYKESGSLMLMTAEGVIDYSGDLKSIKGRGNSTWEADKKPYNIKFDKKTNLLGMGKAKNWCLLANAYDSTNMRNWVTYKIGEKLGCEYTMDCRPVEVYFNGRYNGLYLLTEKVEIDTNRVNIQDLEKETEKVNDKSLDTYKFSGVRDYLPNSIKYVNIPSNPQDITGGYLVEIEYSARYAPETAGFVTKRGQAFVIKSPEYASKEQVEYIADIFQRIEDAAYSENGINENGEKIVDLIDVDSFAKMALMYEIAQERDSYQTSFFFYKDSDATGDGKVHATTLWDFDLSYGGGGEDLKWTSSTWVTLERQNIIGHILKQKEVKDAIAYTWNSIGKEIIEEALTVKGNNYSGELISIEDYEKWIVLASNRNSSIWNNQDWQLQQKDIASFVKCRADMITESVDKGCVLGFCTWDEGEEVRDFEGEIYKKVYTCKVCNSKKENVLHNQFCISYVTRVQNLGWQDWKKDGELSGTNGQSLYLEGIKIEIENGKYSGGIQYRTHIQNLGWQDWKKDGELSGINGQSVRTEAIEIKLYGDMSQNYDVYYRIHAQNIGWLGWAKNGESAGTSGYGYGLEAIQIVLIRKGEKEPISNYGGISANRTEKFLSKRTQEIQPLDTTNVKYRTHVQNLGWQNYSKNGEISGSYGQALRLESIEIDLDNKNYSGGIQYRTHIQNIGWQDWKKDGEISGTSGKSLRLEAIEIRLYGEMAQKYDVYYRVHAQNFGWLYWAKNGETSGTSGYGYRLEGIQIVLVKKGENEPTSQYGGVSSNSVEKSLSKSGQETTKLDIPDVKYRTHIQNLGWQNYSMNGEMSGSSGKSLRLEGMDINLENKKYSGGIQYRTHIQNIGWQIWKKDGEMSGTNGQSLRLEAVEIKLYGEMEQKFDVYYRVHTENFGWLAWAKNGEVSGTSGYGYRLEGIQVVIMPKGQKPSDNLNGIQSNVKVISYSK